MERVFHWFYSLPFVGVLLLILLATAAFFFLREKFGNSPYWKTGILLLLLCWIAVIFFGTLGYRSEGGNLSEPVILPFASYFAVLNGGTKELIRTNFMNIVLFYPAGLLFYELLPKRGKDRWKVLLVMAIFMLISLEIEYTQYRFSLGLAETDDVIHNTLGASLGGIICSFLGKFNTKAPPVA